MRHHRFNKNTTNKLPDVAFCYYRNACCVAETARRVGLSESTVSKLIDSGAAKEYLDTAEKNDARWDPDRQPFRTLLRRSGTTTGRYTKRIIPTS